MLTINQLQKHYSNFELNLSVKLPTGKIIGILGPNGAGKSTLFKLLLGLIQPDHGQLLWNNQPLAAWINTHPTAISTTFPDSGFNENLTIVEIQHLLAAFYPTSLTPDFLNQCRQLDLPINKPIKNFSTGMQAKLKLLIALSHAAELLILDEPTTGLDVTVRATLLEMIETYHQQHPQATILISSHIAGDIDVLAEHIVLITTGQLQLQSDLATVRQQYGLFTVSTSEFQQLDSAHLDYYWIHGNQVTCLTTTRSAYPQLNQMTVPSIDDLLRNFSGTTKEVTLA